MELDFKNTHTTYSTHGFHTYPAKMIPQVANALLDEFGKKASLVFDPYCGSGTSLVEANVHNVSAIGTDINPLARLIAKVKTTPIEQQSLDLHIRDFYEYLFKFRFGFSCDDSIILPAFKNIDFWLSKKVKGDLGIISHYIQKIENSDIRDFFKVALSQTIRDCSWTRKNEFKLYKMSAEQVKVFKPDALSNFEKTLGKNRNGLIDFMAQMGKKAKSQICSFNSIDGVPESIIKPNSVDLVITSPPYGDSATTVAYGQFSALANQWMGFLENGRSLDLELMGGRRKDYDTRFPASLVLDQQIPDVKSVNSKRAEDVVSFYREYEKSIQNVSTTVKKRGVVCYVVSNRNVAGVTLRTDLITKDFFANANFKHLQTIERKISNKRMPKQNSPMGKIGEKGNLMNTEYVVIMQKK